MSCTGLRVAPGVHLHTPAEVTAFDVSYVDGLGAGETLVTVSSTAVIEDDAPGLGAPLLVVDSATASSPVVNVIVSGGVAGATYFVNVKVTTSLGQTLEGAVQVVCDDAV